MKPVLIALMFVAWTTNTAKAASIDDIQKASCLVYLAYKQRPELFRGEVVAYFEGFDRAIETITDLEDNELVRAYWSVCKDKPILDADYAVDMAIERLASQPKAEASNN